MSYYDCDAIGRTTRVDNRDGEGAVISRFDYERDAVGNPISIQREDGRKGQQWECERIA